MLRHAIITLRIFTNLATKINGGYYAKAKRRPEKYL